MDTKSLASAIVGFLLGGLVVSIAATQGESEPHSSPAYPVGATAPVVAGT